MLGHSETLDDGYLEDWRKAVYPRQHLCYTTLFSSLLNTHASYGENDALGASFSQAFVSECFTLMTLRQPQASVIRISFCRFTIFGRLLVSYYGL